MTPVSAHEQVSPPPPRSSWACIDADVHPTIVGGLPEVSTYMPRSWRRRFEGIVLPGARYDNPHGVVRRDAATPDGLPGGADPEFMKADLLDPHHVECAMLYTLDAGRATYLPGRGDGEVAVAAYNDYLAERWLPADDRFRLAITVSPRVPEAAAAEIRRWADHPHVAAIYVPPHADLLGDPRHDPIYEAAQEAGLPVTTHPGAAECDYMGGPTLAGIPSNYIQRRAMLSQVAQSNLVSLVLEGTFERFKRLKVVFIEYGFGWVAPLLWRMDKDWRGLRRTVPWVKRSPIEYVREHVRFTTQPMEEPPVPAYLNDVVKMMYGEETLMFSSDYPHWDNDFPRANLSGLPKDVRSRILLDNARATLRL